MDGAARAERPTVPRPRVRRFAVRDWRQEAGRNRDRRKKRAAKEKGRHQTQGLPAGPILRCDLHGATAAEAEARALEVLGAAGEHQPRPSHVEFIHGHSRGTALRNVVEAVASRLGKAWMRHPTNDGATLVEV
jgi:hypothetical protein